MKGLVLAGGGAKGSYQVGVWKALRQLGWCPDIITGTSVGSLNGAMFAAGQAEAAEELWLSMTMEGVVNVPEEWQEVKDFVKNGGLDVTPLENKINQLLTEEAVRCSPIRFGLVAVEMHNLHAHELSIDQIPQGELEDYLLASSACFPAFRPREINGVKYIDGGYSDNMPFGLAARMGATELLCVDINGIGFNRLNLTGLPTKIIESRWDLGGILEFDPVRAARNIRLGYLDTLRKFGQYQGDWYAIIPEPAFFDLLGESLAEVAAVKLGQGGSRLWKELVTLAQRSVGDDLGDRAALPLLESAARHYGVDPTRPYTARELCREVLTGWDKENAEQLPEWDVMSRPGLPERKLLVKAVRKILQ